MLILQEVKHDEATEWRDVEDELPRVPSFEILVELRGRHGLLMVSGGELDEVENNRRRRRKII